MIFFSLPENSTLVSKIKKEAMASGQTILLQLPDEKHRHHIKYTYHLPCFALLVLLVDTAKINFEEQSLVADTKQRSKDDKEDRLTSQAGWQACLLCSGPACLFCALY
jgi:hypothetical protein